jgi:hypothetical protein
LLLVFFIVLAPGLATITGVACISPVGLVVGVGGLGCIIVHALMFYVGLVVVSMYDESGVLST